MEDLVDGGLAGVAHVLLDVRPVHEGQVDGPGDVGRGQNENVGCIFYAVQLGEKRVYLQ